MRIFLVAKGGGEDFSGRIIEGCEERQARPTLVEPGVRATVELDEEAFPRHPLAAAPMPRWAAAARAGQTRRTQDAAEGGT